MCIYIYIYIYIYTQRYSKVFKMNKHFKSIFGILPSSVYLSKNHIDNLIFTSLQFDVKRLQR